MNSNIYAVRTSKWGHPQQMGIPGHRGLGHEILTFVAHKKKSNDKEKKFRNRKVDPQGPQKKLDLGPYHYS